MNKKNPPKKVYIRTFGCQMNARDSEVIAGLLINKGYLLAENPENADVIIFNTCSVRQHAEDRVWSEIGRFKAVNRKENLRDSPCKAGTVPIIGLVGCMAQNYKEKAFERAPNIDFVVGPADIRNIPEIIEKLSVWSFQLSDNRLFEKKIWETGGELRPDEIYRSGYYTDKNHAYVVISEGCSNFCSYCVVPYVRGELHNRRHQDILDEIARAVDRGIARITLLGQNVNSYSNGNVDFVKLVKLVNIVKGLKNFSFITSHPKDTSIGLFEAMRDCEKLEKYLHLPVQSGSDRVLKAMNRGYSRKHYLDLADKYREIVKGGALATDIIVGFPSETEKDFQDTYDLVKGTVFNSAFIFKYSPRQHTQAEALKDDVSAKEKQRRHALILDLQRKISRDNKGR